ncbi:RiPP maturation radical SAM C-methyltransferase [Labedaea rhizosphaerae]|uniref:Ribosomal peptide maturation radical SAM protein 1 n=1 Tax=Labedaea rhizosphaerae TaxID=598644 RepID=A0A4R6S9W1_LABRH|nr:RiPP maturation radical SAM C-methyltransferase [Labedaea rhizosphaerae]TDP96799.1 ribosomal peptide maturation radical SAM protein 1 [Labedaea rhizosphaerae]
MTEKTLPLLQVSPKAPEPLGPPARSLRVALVNMPWARVDAPSIQCGLLASIVRNAGHHCTVHYLNVELAAVVGPKTYNGIADAGGERLHQFGEWLFSYAAFGELRPDSEYHAEFPDVEEIWRDVTGEGIDTISTLRRETLPRWLAEWADAVDWSGYDIIGFSSTFLQNTASLALGRILKDKFPEVALLYGGANFDGEMGAEYLRKLPWIDHVVTGEGDHALPALLHRLAAGEPLTGVPGVWTRGATGPATESTRTQDLDTLPVPDYTEYFAAIERHGAQAVVGDEPVKLLVEFARGCWWGQKHHCTFCGLNALGMGFRPKTGERAMHELEQMLRAHPVTHVEAVDNILDMKHLSTLCASLAEKHWDVSTFYEVKANLTREQLAVLAAAGINRIQPGIESLSTHVLNLMRKGSTKLINVRLLKWARYHDIKPEWNILSGFPGETDADYAEQAALVPLLYHLRPPDCGGILWLERFSPYFTDETFGITNVRPRACYRFVYPETLDHSKIAYYFDYEAPGIASQPARKSLYAAVGEWRRKWREEVPPSLTYRRLPTSLTITDRRLDTESTTTYTGWQADVYEACGDTARAAKRLHQDILDQGHNLTLDDVTAFLDDCCANGMMLTEDDKYLALAIPENRHW